MKRSEFWNRLFNSGGNGIFVFVGTALIAVIAIVITACPGAADATPEEPKFTVSYHANGGEGTPDPATQEVNHNDIIAAAPTVSRPDYTLNAVWNTKADGTGETFKFGNGGTPITADITLYAQWTKQHTVSYNVNEGEGTPDPATQTVSDGGTATKPADPTRSGYVFTGWFDADTGGNEYTFGTAVTDDITLYAQWSNQQYTVSYHANGGDGTPNPATQGINHNDIIATAPTVSRPGYALNAAWNTQANGQGTPFIFGTTQVTSDMDLYAQWTINQYSVSYNLNEGDGTAPAAETVNYKGTTTKPSEPTRTGYVFTGWFDAATGGNEFNFGSGGTPVTEDIELYAQWTIMTYTVSYNFNRGDSTAPATETVNYKGTATKPSEPTRSGHVFTGWFDAATGGSVYNFGTEVTADIELYAQWIKQYTVSYNVNGGESTAPANETVNDGEFATEPTDPTRTGHTFNGWYTAETGGDAFDFGRAVTAAIELYAQWTIITYTVSYDFNRGDSTEPSTETVEHGGTATRPTTDPTRTGYTFTGWFDAATGGSVYNFGTEVTANIELYAQWIKQYTVSYNVNGGDSPAPANETVNDAEFATEPTEPTRTGYTFAGWFDAQSDGNEFSFGSGGTAVTDDITLYAQWTINTYTVSYNFNRGDSTEPSTETVEHGGTATRPTTDPTRIGYTFTGWFDAASGGSVYNFGTEVTADIELYAQWTINQYTVSYHANQGEGTPNPETQTVNYGETIAAAPTGISRPGYTLNTAWNTNADGTGSSFLFGVGGTAVTEDITLYAQWTPTLMVSGLNPADGSTTTDTTPTFNWNAVPGAAGYELRIAESQPGLDSATTVSVTGPSYTPSAGLTIGQTYYWRVRAKDGADQKGIWSAAYSLEVAVPQGFVHVAGGIFQMGSTDSEAYSNESPVHSVTVDSFYMAETEVTHEQFLEFLNDAGVSAAGQLNGNEVVDMDDSDVAFSHDGTKFSFAASSYADDIACPVIEVTWYGAVEYSNWLSEQEGLSKAYSISGTSVSWNQSANGYRLPTEAEWEYAARGGAQSNGYKYAGSNDVDEVGWYWDNSGRKTQPVKGKKANELGLYDMSGNVWEWCWDWYGSTYYSSSPGANPTGPSSGSYRVWRGGSWFNLPEYLRVAYRGSINPDYSDIYLGFRLVLRTN